MEYKLKSCKSGFQVMLNSNSKIDCEQSIKVKIKFPSPCGITSSFYNSWQNPAPINSDQNILWTLMTNPSSSDRQSSLLCEKHCSHRSYGHNRTSILQNNPFLIEYKNFNINSVKIFITSRVWKAAKQLEGAWRILVSHLESLNEFKL